MLHINAKTFNPEILYAFDAETEGPHTGKNHYHDFFEMSIIVDGGSYYEIDGISYYFDKGTILLFNPGTYHYEHIPAGKSNRQLHIGMRRFSIDRFPREVFPLDTTIIRLSEYHDAFFQACEEIITERRERKSGHDIILKALILKLMVYILRDKNTDSREDTTLLLTEDEQVRQQLVDEVKLYIEANYSEDLTLNQIAKIFYTSPTTISRVFKEQLGETPINYLIRFRLEKAKALIENDKEISVTETAHLIGYEDALYFSKLFKKYYGSSPTNYMKNEDPE